MAKTELDKRQLRRAKRRQAKKKALDMKNLNVKMELFNKRLQEIGESAKQVAKNFNTLAATYKKENK